MATLKLEASTQASPPAPAERHERGWRPDRLSVRQYLGMIDAGVFPDHARLELIGGLLSQDLDRFGTAPRRRRAISSTNGPREEPMTKGDSHHDSALALSVSLRRLLGDDWLISEEKSLSLNPASGPEPDLAIPRGPVELHKAHRPTARDVALVVEIAESSYRYDRDHKWKSYAAAPIPVSWIVHPQKRQAEVYRDPTAGGTSAEYRSAETFGEDAIAPVLMNGNEVGRIAVRDILP